MRATLRFGVLEELGQHVDEARAVERVTPDAHTRGLTQPDGRRLVDRLVCQSARSRNDPC